MILWSARCSVIAKRDLKELFLLGVRSRENIRVFAYDNWPFPSLPPTPDFALHAPHFALLARTNPCHTFFVAHTSVDSTLTIPSCDAETDSAQIRNMKNYWERKKNTVHEWWAVEQGNETDANTTSAIQKKETWSFLPKTRITNSFCERIHPTFHTFWCVWQTRIRHLHRLESIMSSHHVLCQGVDKITESNKQCCRTSANTIKRITLNLRGLCGCFFGWSIFQTICSPSTRITRLHLMFESEDKIRNMRLDLGDLYTEGANFKRRKQFVFFDFY